MAKKYLDTEGLSIVSSILDNKYIKKNTLTGTKDTIGLIKNGSSITSASGLTACPIINGIPYYKDTNTTYTLSSFGVTATSKELNYCDGVTSNILAQLNGKVGTDDSRLTNARPAAGGTSSKVYDINGSTPITFAYSSGGNTTPDYFAVWNGYQVTYVSKARVKELINTDTNTWRPITSIYNGSLTDTCLSQKGANDLYNTLLNGYASSAGNSDTVDGKHASDFATSGHDHGNSYVHAKYGNLQKSISIDWSGEFNNDTAPYLLAWNSNGDTIRAISRASLNVNYANSAGSAKASDVYGWAKASSKPSYSVGEISGAVSTSQLNNKADKVNEISSSSTNITLQPNKLYKFGIMTNLTIALGSAISGIANVYTCQFKSGGTATRFQYPSTIVWAETKATDKGKPKISPNKSYEVSIINNQGIIGEFLYE